MAAGGLGSNDASSGERSPGVVIRSYGKFVDVVFTDGSQLLCTMKGSVKRDRRRTDVIAVGDRVLVTDLGGGEGQVEAVLPRERVLSRLARHTTDTEQVILANLDQVLFVFAVRDPEPHLRMLDRFLLLAEIREIPSRIVVSKMDLDGPVDGLPSLAHALFGAYESAYPVHYLSVRTGEGIEELRSAISSKITAVAGPSGVGKSSLLNALDPAGDRQVGAISEATGKGRHTTIATQLRQVQDLPATFVADTPGMRALSLRGIPPEKLDECFPEFRPYLGKCFYGDCTHLHEPECAVREALRAGEIPAQRYESYAAMRRGESLD